MLVNLVFSNWYFGGPRPLIENPVPFRVFFFKFPTSYPPVIIYRGHFFEGKGVDGTHEIRKLTLKGRDL